MRGNNERGTMKEGVEGKLGRGVGEVSVSDGN